MWIRWLVNKKKKKTRTERRSHIDAVAFCWFSVASCIRVADIKSYFFAFY